MEFYKKCNTIFMKAKRWLIILTVTVVSLLVVCGTAFFLLTEPAVKIGGWATLDTAKLERIHQTVTIKGLDGNIVADGIYSHNRIYTPLSEIPEHTKNAFICIEDKRFYRHHGVDYVRMMGALKNNVRSASFKEGASTITQQLIKNTHLSNKKTFSRKFQEIRIAKELERNYSKDRILEAYLNIIYFGNNVYGIGQAARTYFDKDVANLDVAESALLAGIINNPTRFNPLLKKENAIKRRNVVIDRMADIGKIEKTDVEREKAKDIIISPMHQNPYSVYIENVLTEAARVLDCLAEELFEKKPTIIVNTKTGTLNDIYSGMSDILYKTGHDVRALVVDNFSSLVVGDYGNIFNSPTIRRQPGSALKPFVAFAPALEKKCVYPVSILQDEKTDFSGYSPKNFADKYYGDITVSDSLKYSLNIPAVKLTDMCGVEYAKSIASRFGLPFSDKDNGLAVALGGLNEGVTLYELANAYSALANGGVYSPASYINSIQVDGKCVYKKKNTQSRAVGSDTAFLLTEMLRECAQTGTAKKLACFHNVAAKTGTVERGDKNSDAYCVAYTPRYTVAVWFGNDDDGKPIYGGNEPTALVKKILEVLHDTNGFTVPDTVTKLDIDTRKLTDEKAVYLAGADLPPRYRKSCWFSKNHLPTRYSYFEIPFIFDDTFDSDNFDDFEILYEIDE